MSGPPRLTQVSAGKDRSALSRLLNHADGVYGPRVFHNQVDWLLDEMTRGRSHPPFIIQLDAGVAASSDYIAVLKVGMNMEAIDEALKLTRRELDESKKTLKELLNELTALEEAIEPKLVAHIQRLRAARMAAVNEISQSLQALRDIRKFFIESDYATEVGRLREFVALCEQVQRLKENGTLDAISDAILRLAVAPAKEGQP